MHGLRREKKRKIHLASKKQFCFFILKQAKHKDIVHSRKKLCDFATLRAFYLFGCGWSASGYFK